jgi:hypothetical protein
MDEGIGRDSKQVVVQARFSTPPLPSLFHVHLYNYYYMYLFYRKLGFCLQGHMCIINYDKPFGLVKDLLIIASVIHF